MKRWCYNNFSFLFQIQSRGGLYLDIESTGIEQILALARDIPPTRPCLSGSRAEFLVLGTAYMSLENSRNVIV